MANEQIKISELTEVTSVTGNEEMPVVQSGSTKKMSLNQAKDFIGGAGVIIFPEDILELKQDSTSDEIFTAFGGKTNYNNTISKLKLKSLIKIGDGPLYLISLVVGASYTDEDNSQVVIQSLSLNVSFYLQVTVTNGTAKALVAKYTFVDAANVLQKNNTDAFTPTSDYQPATKKYVDDSGDIILNMDDYQAGGSFNSEERLKFDKWFSQNNHPVCFTGTQSEGAIFTNATVHEDAGVKYVHIAPIQIAGTNLMIYDILEFHVENGINSYTYNKYMDINKCIVLSDNLTTITKKTAAEYEALGSKDANTVYCVTD